MSFKKLRTINLGLISLGALIIIIALVIDGYLVTLIMGIVGVLIILASQIINLRHWRCPKCGGVLPLRAYKSMKFCPYCAEEIPFLQEEDDEE